jgi:acyl-CoA synthetase (AMP-forming)/AMP-acid ligase II
VGILSLNCYEALAAFFGTMRAGMVTVPISFKLPPEMVRYIVGDAGLQAILHHRERAPLPARAAVAQPCPEALKVPNNNRPQFLAIHERHCHHGIQPGGNRGSSGDRRIIRKVRTNSGNSALPDLAEYPVSPGDHG